MWLRRPAIFGLFLTLTACAAARQDTTPVHASAPTLVGPPRPWAELSHEERARHMAQHVQPAAAELFQAWDPDRYADFDCGTCHGADAAARDYAMPNPSIIALYPTGTVGQVETLNRYLEASTFMYSRLLPAVQTMVGGSEFDPVTGRGFSCYSCHPHAADDDPRNRPSGS